MKRLINAAMVIGVLVLSTTLLSAQAPAGQGRRGGGAPPAPLKNLQVLPKDTTLPQILPTMRAFEASLQVECGHCHVWYGNGNPMNDFASDAKPQKNIARAMIKMVMAANDTIKPAVVQSGLRTADQVQAVTCATCHRGSAIPMVPQYTPPAPPGGAGRPGGGAPGAGAGAAEPGR
jgi:hypothetical protein